MRYDKIIIGAGLYGLYSALYCGKNNEEILVIEKDSEAFKRATYINQARVHMGYHYPRSYSTAIKSAKYFDRFNEDYAFCIFNEFDQIYATSTMFSWTDAKQFKKFCDNTDITCEELAVSKYFKDGMCDGAFLTKEYTYDAQILKEYFLTEIRKLSNVKILYNADIDKIKKQENRYEIQLENGEIYESGFILNSTYAGVNQILDKLRI